MDSSTGTPPVPPPVPRKLPPPAGQPVPINAPKPTSAAPIVIRTMQDDLADLKKAPLRSPQASSAGQVVTTVPVKTVPPPTPIQPITRTPITATAVSAPATVPQRFPLPPRPATTQGQAKTVATPPPRPERHLIRRLVVVFLVFIFLGGIGLGGWYAWTKWGGVAQLTTKPSVVVPTQAVSPEDKLIEFEISGTDFQQLRQSLAGKNFAVGQLQGLNLQGKFNVDRTALTFTGSSSWQTPLRPAGSAGQAFADLRLLTMVPGDATLVRLGSNFQEDIGRWQAVSQVIPVDVLAAPATASLVAQLSNPYAYYHRLGPDGSLDLGMVVEIPTALVGQLALGETGLEEGLQALVPLLLEQTQVAPVVFTDTTYNDVRLRYVNLVGTTQTLDYAISGNHLLICTSKEGMRALIDTVKGAAASFTPPAAWTIPAGREVVLGSINQSALLELPPHDAKLTALPFGLSFIPREVGVAVEGIVQLDE